VNKEDPQQAERKASSKAIEDLARAIEELASRSKKTDELEGIMAEARVLVQEWKIKEPSGHRRPLFDDTVSPITLLLAALVTALRRDHEFVEQIRRHCPNELEKLRHESSWADAVAVMEASAGTQSKPTSGQKYEWKRRTFHRGKIGLIELEFGSALDARIQESVLLLGPTPAIPPACLDDVSPAEPSIC
jgi:hypothetical protein